MKYWISFVLAMLLGGVTQPAQALDTIFETAFDQPQLHFDWATYKGLPQMYEPWFVFHSWSPDGRFLVLYDFYGGGSPIDTFNSVYMLDTQTQKLWRLCTTGKNGAADSGVIFGWNTNFSRFACQERGQKTPLWVWDLPQFKVHAESWLPKALSHWYVTNLDYARQTLYLEKEPYTSGIMRYTKGHKLESFELTENYSPCAFIWEQKNYKQLHALNPTDWDKTKTSHALRLREGLEQILGFEKGILTLDHDGEAYVLESHLLGKNVKTVSKQLHQQKWVYGSRLSRVPGADYVLLTLGQKVYKVWPRSLKIELLVDCAPFSVREMTVAPDGGHVALSLGPDTPDVLRVYRL